MPACSLSFVKQSILMIFMVLALKPFLVHRSKLTSLTYKALKVRFWGAGIRTLFAETAHPAIGARAGVGALADAAVLAREPTDSWKHHEIINDNISSLQTQDSEFAA